MTKTYIEFMYRGALVSETETKEVQSRLVAQAYTEMPPNAYAYRFFDVEELDFGNSKGQT